jgi:hypothetical protein
MEPKIECKHEWYVVTKIDAIPWEVRMSQRLTEEEELLRSISFQVTHTLICKNCYMIKNVNN